MWSSLTPSKKAALTLSVSLIVLLTGYASWVVLNPVKAVLFSQMDEAEAANVVNGLKALKVDYQLQDNGTTILVDKNKVDEARLDLLSNGVGFNNTVGMELFDNADYGMTEFAQKVNFQRALQGELARTIMSLDEVKYARVHITIPENSLFSEQRRSPKASITLISEQGKALSAKQITGIQTLVASSVNELEAADVAIIDENGVEISPLKSEVEGDEFMGNSLLQKKQDYEHHIENKVNGLLDPTLGKGNYAVSVNVDFDFSKTTLVSENILTQNGKDTGYVKQKRESVKYDADTQSDNKTRQNKKNQETTIDYMYGKEVKQTESVAGNVKKISVAVLVSEAVSDIQSKELVNVITAAVGLSAKRGDMVEVQRLVFQTPTNNVKSTIEIPQITQHKFTSSDAEQQPPQIPLDNKWLIVAFFGLAILFAFLIFVVLNSVKKQRTREALLQDIKQLLAAEKTEQKA